MQTLALPPFPELFAGRFLGPALPSPSSLPSCPQGWAHLCLVWCRALRHALSLWFSAPSSCPLRSSGEDPPRLLKGLRRLAESRCHSHTVPNLSSGRQAGEGAQTQVFTNRCSPRVGGSGPGGHTPAQPVLRAVGALGPLQAWPPAPLSGGGPSSLISAEETRLSPLQEPNWSFFLVNGETCPHVNFAAETWGALLKPQCLPRSELENPGRA